MKRINFNEKYLIVLVMLCFVIIGLYYSYAIFVTKQLQENVVVINTASNRALLKVNYENQKINVSAGSKIEATINISNLVSQEINYLIMFKGITPLVKVSSNDMVSGKLIANERKNIIVTINNTSKKNVELEFIIKTSLKGTIDGELGYSYINKVDNFDHSMANKPEINNLNLIPVSYHVTNEKEGYWYKTDINNQEDLWYSYDNGIWANAVLLSNDNYQKYVNAPLNTEIEIGDILGFYVWIPRFKYYIVNNDSYTNYERINNIVFENDRTSTGSVTCIDKISNSLDSHIYSEICNDDVYGRIYNNLSTYTHPSFQDRTGFWVGKFLMGEGNKVLPNVMMVKKNISDAITLSNQNNSHLLTNMEYASIVLLSNSYYGKTGNNDFRDDNNSTFERIYLNNYLYNQTGCSSEYNSYSKNFITNTSKECVEYNNLSNYTHISNSVNYPVGLIGPGASSTGTIYGVYDLSNINGELVGGIVANSDGTIKLDTNNVDLYSYNSYLGQVKGSKNIYNLNRYKLGDAIRENFRSFSNFGMWNNGVLSQNKNSGVLIRGGNGNSEESCIYTVSIEDYDYVAPFRNVLNQ